MNEETNKIYEQLINLKKQKEQKENEKELKRKTLIEQNRKFLFDNRDKFIELRQAIIDSYNGDYYVELDIEQHYDYALYADSKRLVISYRNSVELFDFTSAKTRDYDEIQKGGRMLPGGISCSTSEINEGLLNINTATLFDDIYRSLNKEIEKKIESIKSEINNDTESISKLDSLIASVSDFNESEKDKSVIITVGNDKYRAVKIDDEE